MKNKAFTIIEVIVAIFVIIIGVLAAFTVVQQIVSQTMIASSRLTAAYLAKEGIEIVRNIRDTNWLDPASPPWDDGLLCAFPPCDWEAGYTAQNLADTYDGDFLNIDGSGFYSYFAGSPTKFKRKITVVPDGADKLKVFVEIQWQEKGQNYQINVQENLYDWR